MSFFDETADFAKEVFDQAVVLANETVEIQKLRFAISKKKGEINKKFKALGECYYSVNMGNQSKVDTCAEICQEITSLKMELAQLVNQLEQIKNVRVCPGCGGKNSRSATFCNSCGKKF